MSKRKYDDVLTDEKNWSEVTKPDAFKHSLDSDEDDDEAVNENYNILDEQEIEGAEDGPMASEANVGFTAFNMKEEMEEGHFDKDGHYLFKKDKEVRDNWLDDIDWVKIKPRSDAETKNENEKGLADSDSDDDVDENITFDPSTLYKEILDFLKPGETVTKALCRLGKGKKKISSAERWKRKKAGLSEIDENSEKIIKLTELANELLSRTGNMDIYQDSYESIKHKVDQANKQDLNNTELDMYADDFDSKEQGKLDEPSTSNQTDDDNIKKNLLEQPTSWELKWSQNDDAEVNGPHTTEQMFAWANEGYFKDKGWVRRTGQNGQFYTASRVDFEIYM
ncbi:hypothetical protein HCN44_009415 [Aphidius gifuensis]|uniref:GYF domain-containing protein n=1 Tax=Aphidius gifuensis TaxID=684658 RepID=A0A834Y788_APHGI|nr:CD2 antigen cytoplasmic tail-binding protein 2 homolog [Aphidius gifuensis]KAF7998017.1 hypothetical protein HCN44_009415 [Aphidius gifuensis]